MTIESFFVLSIQQEFHKTILFLLNVQTFYCRKKEKRELTILNFKLEKLFVFLIFRKCQYFVQNTGTYTYYIVRGRNVKEKTIYDYNFQ